jgi:hypothetical protein
MLQRTAGRDLRVNEYTAEPAKFLNDFHKTDFEKEESIATTATDGSALSCGVKAGTMLSPQMMTMFGFCCCAAAGAGTNELSNSAHIIAALKYLQRLLRSAFRLSCYDGQQRELSLRCNHG